MDEPLSNLDAKLRREMRVELKQLQARIGVTTVFVTHDQEEALTLSDRIAVMSAGRIEQLSSPSEIYRRPANRFVAEFIGLANIFPGALEASRIRAGEAAVLADGLVIEASAEAAPRTARVIAVVRPERVQVAAAPAGENSFPGTVQYSLFLGGTRQCGVRLRSGQQITAVVPDAAGALPATDDAVWVHWTPEDVVLLPDAGPGAP
jgi:ABC-type Fe3+/spermidine/putrescine transport system ATPase subunit